MRKRLFLLFLAVLLIIPLAVSCSSGGKKLMTLDDSSISVNIFQYYLAKRKGEIASSLSVGSAALNDSYWDTIVSDDGKTTLDDVLCAEVLELVKLKLAAANTFDRMGLKISKEDLAVIDEEIEELVEFDADGSKNEFNRILANYGINLKILREIRILELKVAKLSEQLYGEGGAKIADSLKEEYYRENYVRFKQIFMYTHKFVYEKDEFGTEIWYKEDGTVSYDTKNGKTKESGGKPVTDADGKTVYFDDDGKIAYSPSGASRRHVYNENGQEKTEAYSSEKINELLEKANGIMSRTVEEEYVLFDSLIAENNEDKGLDAYPNGFYVSRDSVYDKKVIEALFDMKDGEIRLVYSDLGIHILMRYPAEEGGYALESNKDFFIDPKTGGYHFMDALVDKLFKAYLTESVASIKVNESLLEEISMKSVGPNYDY